MKDGRVFGCGKNTSGELGLGEAIPELKHLDKGIKEFIPIYSLKHVNVDQIYAGCLHTYVVINQDLPYPS
jgi:alpha-tubulin suppressor-like RCC1 family protein